ncbi:hypothetical protein BJX66DRAFT_304676 [Aspergillus keveii]|uniref:Uncharacterized protein n=1 Tax=Aspergillus keveii TaxID=714993 RepID=A0ABR4G4W4_9EURO
MISTSLSIPKYFLIFNISGFLRISGLLRWIATKIRLYLKPYIGTAPKPCFTSSGCS